MAWVLLGCATNALLTVFLLVVCVTEFCQCVSYKCSYSLTHQCCVLTDRHNNFPLWSQYWCSCEWVSVVEYNRFLPVFEWCIMDFVEFCREGCNAEKLTTEIIIVCSAALRGVVLLHSACILYHLRSYMCVQIHMINSAFYPFRFGKLVPAVTQKATTILGLSVQRLSFSYAADPVYAFLCTSVMKW